MSRTFRSHAEPGGYGRPVGESRSVVMAFHDPLLNGATISALRAVPALVEMGWSFSFWVPAPGPCFDWLAARGADVRGRFRPVASGLRPMKEPPGLTRRLVSTPGYLAAYRSFLHEVSPVLVHANSLFSFAEALAARALRYPAFLHVHDMAPRGKAPIVRMICRRGVTRCAAVSEACALSYAHDGWLPDLIYEAAPIPPEAVPVRDAPKPFVIGTVGVIARRKGSDLFVRAASDLNRRYPGRFDFRLVGSPNDPLEREWGEQVIADARASGVTHMPQTDVFEEMGEWDAFALPSRMDPCPIAMLEAMASGLPVVGAAADGIPEQVTPECGILVPADDALGLAQGIETVADWSAERRRRAGLAGRARVAECFSLAAQAKLIDRAYRRCLA